MLKKISLLHEISALNAWPDVLWSLFACADRQDNTRFMVHWLQILCTTNELRFDGLQAMVACHEARLRSKVLSALFETQVNFISVTHTNQTPLRMLLYLHLVGLTTSSTFVLQTTAKRSEQRWSSQFLAEETLFSIKYLTLLKEAFSARKSNKGYSRGRPWFFPESVPKYVKLGARKWFSEPEVLRNSSIIVSNSKLQSHLSLQAGVANGS